MYKNWILFREKYFHYFTVLIYIMVTIAGWFGITADTTKIRFDKISVEQEITGWGTSGCWWAQYVGDSERADEIAKLLFSKEEGLGLNIYRYNIGAGEKDNPNTTDRYNEGDNDRKTESFSAIFKFMSFS